MLIPTTDLCDAFEDNLSIVSPMFRQFGKRAAFSGPIATLKLFEDNSLVRSTLESAGKGQVLVIDGGGSMRCALVGDQLALLAVNHGWAGIVVNGCIRDSRTINTMDIGVLALGTHPKRSVKRNTGESGLSVSFGNVTFTPGHYLYADEDGVVVSANALTLQP